jgi:hypothetical protein
MADGAPKRLEQAYQKWLQAQREALDLVLAAQHPGTPTDWAEGIRWLTRQASNALDQVVEKNDPLHPTLYVSQNEFRKYLVDNPDTRYYFAVVDDAQTYRLSGTAGDAPYVGFTFGTDIFHWGSNKAVGGTLAQHYLNQFATDDDGNFEIWISPERRAGNWIQLPKGTHHLAVRETFYDKANTRPCVLRLERVGDPLPPPQATPDAVADKLELACEFLLFSVRAACGMRAYQTRGEPNVITGATGAQHVQAKEDKVRAHSDTDMVYMGGHFRLAPDEALVITMKPPPYDFVYWGLVIVNPWTESYDYRYTTTHWNNGSARRNADGTWTLIVAGEDPGVGNWLDTGGRLEGTITLRWVLAGDAPPAPDCAVVPLASLRR